MTKEKLKEQNIHFYEYPNGDYQYKDDDGIYHLFRDGREIAFGAHIHSYDNYDWRYRDFEGIEHLIRDGQEIATGKEINEIKPGIYKIKSVVILDTTN